MGLLKIDEWLASVTGPVHVHIHEKPGEDDGYGDEFGVRGVQQGFIRKQLHKDVLAHEVVIDNGENINVAGGDEGYLR